MTKYATREDISSLAALVFWFFALTVILINLVWFGIHSELKDLKTMVQTQEIPRSTG